MASSTRRSRKLRRPLFGAATLVSSVALAFAASALTPQDAEACGCTSPPEPTQLDGGDFAVNQSAEQIIFEVENGMITAHVLIRYAGDPARFAWIVPVPDVPTLGLSPSTAFALLDNASQPRINVSDDFICPDEEYYCDYHDQIWCGTGEDGGSFSTGATTGSDSGGTATGGGDPPGVIVDDQQIIGDYEVSTLTATSGAELVTWLQTNGYFVNSTMTPYMQPYLDDGMKFVAAKLIPGAGLDSIKPLRLTYPGTEPVIPLRLTAVAAEPHMPILTYVYGDALYKENTHALIDIDETQLEKDENQRHNYPMVLSRMIDDAGGDAFVREFAGAPLTASFNDDTGCCDSGSDDWCGVGGDGSCQCPLAEFDQTDCADVPELLESITFLDDLAAKHTRMTRIITRMSADEMYFDPTFVADATATAQASPSSLNKAQPYLANCEPDIMDTGTYQTLIEENQCSTLYCGTGACGLVLEGAGCMCDAGSVARAYTEMDGEAAVTCVAKAHPVDFQLDPMVLDICGNVDCGAGTCLELGGVPTCECDAGASAVIHDVRGLTCFPNARALSTGGARPYTDAMRDIPVCAPEPPTCGGDGWLVPNTSAQNHGVMCPSSIPDPDDLVEPEAPTCGDESGGTADSGAETGGASEDGKGACSCSSDNTPGGGFMSLLFLGLFGAGRRRRRS